VPAGHDHIECTGKVLNQRVALIPILRSGLGMIDPMLELVPKAEVHHIGIYRQNLMPVQYYNRLPKKCQSDVAFVVDPLIATARTLISVVGMLKKVRGLCVFFNFDLMINLRLWNVTLKNYIIIIVCALLNIIRQILLRYMQNESIFMESFQKEIYHSLLCVIFVEEINYCFSLIL